MTVPAPFDVVRALFWIHEAQDHINTSVETFDEPEGLAAALELQRLIDAEWDRLGLLVSVRNRPYSVLRERIGG